MENNQHLDELHTDAAASPQGILDRSAPPALSSWLPAAAARWPARIAMETEGRQWSYMQLWADVSALSRQLRQKGLCPGDRLGIAATRSADTVVAILAAVDAGLAYVPLDLSYPPARLRAMVDETLPRVVLGEKSALNELERLIGDFALLDSPAACSQPSAPRQFLSL